MSWTEMFPTTAHRTPRTRWAVSASSATPLAPRPGRVRRTELAAEVTEPGGRRAAHRNRRAPRRRRRSGRPARASAPGQCRPGHPELAARDQRVDVDADADAGLADGVSGDRSSPRHHRSRGAEF